MKLVRLIPKKLVLTRDNFEYSAFDNTVRAIFQDVSGGLISEVAVEYKMDRPSQYQPDRTNDVCKALVDYYKSPLRDLAIMERNPDRSEYSFYIEEVQVEHTDFMHTYEKSVTTSALIEIQIDELEGENGDNKYQFEGQVFEPKDLVKRLQGYPTSDVLQLLYAANISHRQYSPLELAQEINNGSDNFSNSYVIATVTIEVQSGTK